MKARFRFLFCLSFTLAFIEAHGEFTAPIEDRVEYLRTQAAKGDAVAQYNFAVLYESGVGVPKSMSEAIKWYKRAADQGLAEAQYALGIAYQQGGFGVPQNDSEAVTWFRKAAEQNHAAAEYEYGFMNDMGRGIPKNNSEAAIWYGRAALQGNKDAQFSLGTMYAFGAGVARDRQKAHAWWSIARSNGKNEAGEYLRKIEKDMSPTEIAEAEKVARILVDLMKRR